MLRITRRGDRHDPKELVVSFRFEGAFAAAFRDGKADGLPPGEALKNLVHRTAREFGSGEIEEFGLAICDRVLKEHTAVTRARVDITEHAWTRLDANRTCEVKVTFLAARAGTSTATLVLQPDGPPAVEVALRGNRLI